jgi:hypothetical protein
MEIYYNEKIQKIRDLIDQISGDYIESNDIDEIINLIQDYGRAEYEDGYNSAIRDVAESTDRD